MAARVDTTTGVAAASSTRRPGTLDTGTSTDGHRPAGHNEQRVTTKGQHTTMISQRKGATAGVAAAALLALSLTTGFGGTPRSTPPSEPAASGSAAGGSAASGGGDFVLGVSNTLAGNGWREEMICAVKAQALASG